MHPATVLRPPAVAGIFYPGSASQLRIQIQSLLAASKPTQGRHPPKALLIPHAGYIYSGPIAASAYAMLRPWADFYRRVVLIGPAHHLHFRGIAIPESGVFATPLGEIPLDLDSLDEISQLSSVVRLEAAHEREHALEVQLPFLQETLTNFSLIPLLVGLANPADVTNVLRAIWYGPETLILISSDLSHYLPYDLACSEDHHTLELIQKLEPFLHPEQACGALALSGFLQAARERKLEARLLDYRNSGDTAGDKERVVGYASMVFGEVSAHS